jgi:hypothetical protein
VEFAPKTRLSLDGSGSEVFVGRVCSFESRRRLRPKILSKQENRAEEYDGGENGGEQSGVRGQLLVHVNSYFKGAASLCEEVSAIGAKMQ